MFDCVVDVNDDVPLCPVSCVLFLILFCPRGELLTHCFFHSVVLIGTVRSTQSTVSSVVSSEEQEQEEDMEPRSRMRRTRIFFRGEGGGRGVRSIDSNESMTIDDTGLATSNKNRKNKNGTYSTYYSTTVVQNSV